MNTWMIKAASAVLLVLTGIAHATEVEVYLADKLDNKQIGYCLDIGGGKERDAKISAGLQGHTCYSNLGALGVDQTFETGQFAEGLLYMPKFDVCATLASLEAGAGVGLAACDGRALQQFVFSGQGVITPASATHLCLTLGEATRSGRSDTNQIKALTLEACDRGKSAYQQWAVRSMTQ